MTPRKARNGSRPEGLSSVSFLLSILLHLDFFFFFFLELDSNYSSPKPIVVPQEAVILIRPSVP